MPTLTIPEDATLCAGVPLQLDVLGCDGATRSLWEVIAKPVGSQIIFSDPTDPFSSIDVTQDGEYTFRLSCFFDDGEVITNPITNDPVIGCPNQVQVGEVGIVTLTGCDNDNVEWTVTGAATTFFGASAGGVSIPTSTTGTVNVEAVCTRVDNDGNETTTTVTCSFDIVDVEADDTEYSEEFILYVEPCGVRCDREDITVVFDCNAVQTQTVEFGVVVKECPECVEDEPCVDLEIQTLVGSVVANDVQFDVLEDCGCYQIFDCEPDMPALFWNNLCTCPGWTLDAPAVAGSSIYNACSCNPGQQWCFDTTATIVASGPAQLVDTLIIWGHNMSDATITVSPLSTVDGNVVSVGVIDDGACIGGYTAPVVINFANVPESITDLTITISSNNPGIVCINQIFIGSKVFLPDDRLPASFVNPHDGTDYSLEVKESECGPLSRSLVHTPVSLTLDIECADLQWIKTKWRPFLRYAQRYGFLFQHSRNNCPNDLFNGWLPDPVGGSVYNQFQDNTVSVTAQGYITQPQPVEFV